MTEELPPPPVPADCDLRDFPFTPLFRARLFGSSFHARSTDAEWRAGVTLWLKSWDQFPAGSLPDDDIDLCRLAELGRDIKTWAKIKDGAMRGWFRCSDGRLYHAVVAEGVLEAWEKRVEHRQNRDAWRNKKRRQREKVYGDTAGTDTECPPGQTEMSPGTNGNVHQDVPRDNALKGQGEGQGQGNNSVGAEAPSTPRATRLPPDWSLPDDWRSWAKTARPEVDPDQEAAKFCDFWRAKSGRDATKLDWQATWRNWVRNARPSANLAPAKPKYTPLGVGG